MNNYNKTKCLNSDEISNNVTLIESWKSQKGIACFNNLLPVFSQLLAIVASSASVQ